MMDYASEELEEAEVRRCASDMCQIFRIAHLKRQYLSVYNK